MRRMHISWSMGNKKLQPDKSKKGSSRLGHLFLMSATLHLIFVCFSKFSYRRHTKITKKCDFVLPFFLGMKHAFYQRSLCLPAIILIKTSTTYYNVALAHGLVTLRCHE